MARKLMRSTSDKMICGVAAGMAHYIGIDATFVRLAWVIAVLIPGPNLIFFLVYLVLCIVMRREDPTA